MQIRVIKCSDASKWYSDLVGLEFEAKKIDTHGRAVLISTSNKLLINKGDFEKTSFTYTYKRETYTQDEKMVIFDMLANGYTVADISEKFDLKLAYCYLLRAEWNKLIGVHLGAKNEPYYNDEEEAQREFCARYEDLSEIEKKIYDSL
jgi:hypothetical protein